MAIKVPTAFSRSTLIDLDDQVRYFRLELPRLAERIRMYGGLGSRYRTEVRDEVIHFVSEWAYLGLGRNALLEALGFRHAEIKMLAIAWSGSSARI